MDLILLVLGLPFLVASYSSMDCFGVLLCLNFYLTFCSSFIFSFMFFELLYAFTYSFVGFDLVFSVLLMKPFILCINVLNCT